MREKEEELVIVCSQTACVKRFKADKAEFEVNSDDSDCEGADLTKSRFELADNLDILHQPYSNKVETPWGGAKMAGRGGSCMTTYVQALSLQHRLRLSPRINHSSKAPCLTSQSRNDAIQPLTRSHTIRANDRSHQHPHNRLIQPLAGP